jgi:trigger factor
MREQVIDQLADAVKVELPEKLSAQQAARTLEQYRLELLYQGLSTEEVEERLAERRGDSEAMARDGLKRFFLLHRLGEHFSIEVSEQEINGRIAAIAAQRNARPEKLRAELAQSGRLGEVARLIRDQKAADRVVQQVKKVDVTAEEWNEIFKARQKARSKPSEKPARKPAKKAAEKEPREAPKAKAAEAAPKKKTTKKK